MNPSLKLRSATLEVVGNRLAASASSVACESTGRPRRFSASYRRAFAAGATSAFARGRSAVARLGTFATRASVSWRRSADTRFRNSARALSGLSTRGLLGSATGGLPRGSGHLLFRAARSALAPSAAAGAAARIEDTAFTRRDGAAAVCGRAVSDCILPLRRRFAAFDDGRTTDEQGKEREGRRANGVR
jgi:hypothetical protein